MRLTGWKFVNKLGKVKDLKDTLEIENSSVFIGSKCNKIPYFLFTQIKWMDLPSTMSIIKLGNDHFLPLPVCSSLRNESWAMNGWTFSYRNVTSVNAEKLHKIQ